MAVGGASVALMEIRDFEDERKRLFRGRHLKASDDYYEWYAGERLSEDRCVYHLCEGPGKRCQAKLTSRDRRELVHVPRWRVINSGMMLNEGYSRDEGLARIREGVRRFVPHPVLHPAPPLREERGTGLDRVVQDLPDEDDREVPSREKAGEEEETERECTTTERFSWQPAQREGKGL